MSKENAVVKQEKSDTDLMALVEEDAATNTEVLDAEDYAIPRLSVLQSLSPQCIKQESSYIEGAEPGMIFNNVTRELIDGEIGLVVLPIKMRKTYLEWTPKKAGGGFVADHGNNPDILDNCKTEEDSFVPINPVGNHVVLTYEYYVHVLPGDGSWVPAVISLSASQLKYARKFNTLMKQVTATNSKGEIFNPKSYYRSYQFSTMPESNNKGSWFSWQITYDDNVLEIKNGPNIYRASSDFEKSISKGRVKVSQPADGPGGSATPEAESDPM